MGRIAKTKLIILSGLFVVNFAFLPSRSLASEETVRLYADFSACGKEDGRREQKAIDLIATMDPIRKRLQLDENRWREFVLKAHGDKVDFFACYYDAIQASMRDFEEKCKAGKFSKNVCEKKKINDLFSGVRMITQKVAKEPLVDAADQFDQDLGEAIRRTGIEAATSAGSVATDVAKKDEEKGKVDSKDQTTSFTTSVEQRKKDLAKTTLPTTEDSQKVEAIYGGDSILGGENLFWPKTDYVQIIWGKSLNDFKLRMKKGFSLRDPVTGDPIASIVKEPKFDIRKKLEIEERERSEARAISDCLVNEQGRETIARIEERMPNPFEIVKASACSDIERGQFITVNIPENESPTGVEHRYKLSRLDANRYEAALNLNFSPVVDPGKASLGDVDGIFRKRVAECMDGVNGALRGPNGKEIVLRLTEKNEVGTVPVEIKITHPGIRANSRQYAMDTSCEVITHEIMHLLGLCDEYKEDRIGYIYDEKSGGIKHVQEGASSHDYDCRVIGPSDSLMNDTWAAFKKVFGEFHETVCTCGDRCKVEYDPNKKTQDQPPYARWVAENFHNWSDTTRCPPGMSSTTTYISPYGKKPSITRDLKNMTMKIIGPISNDLDGGLGMNGSGNSLLKPAHFNAIVYPNCDKNKTYYSCVQNAYSTKKKAVNYNGKSFDIGDGCKASVPQECINGSDSWLR